MDATKCEVDVGGVMPRTLVGLIAVIAILSYAGCMAAQRLTTGGIVPGKHILGGSKILILPVADGVERADGPAAGSGTTVTSAIRAALIAHGVAVVVLDTEQGSEPAARAVASGCSYYLKGSIPEWEDNATEWSGKPDVAALSLELFEADTRELAGAASHQVSSSTGQGFSRRPDRFVPELVDHALGKLFGWTPSIVTPK
jgi:hypothetical protein